MNWTCSVCGFKSRTKRRRCANCGNMKWRPIPTKDSSELGGPTKRIAPKGLLLAKPGRQAPIPDPNIIECGVCHAIIYKVEGIFNPETFAAEKKKHYSTSPKCEPKA